MENAGPGSGVRNTGSRGMGSGGVENTGSAGKYGVWWKTRGLSEKHRGTIISPNNELSRNFVISNCNENQSA